MSENWRQSEICIVINDKSRGSIAKHLRFKIAGEKNVKTGEHLAKLQAKRLTALFGLHFCPQNCGTRHISKITCVLWTETVTIVVVIV